MKDKWVCENYRCGWHGTKEKVLKASNPFVEGELLWACPNCMQQSIVKACDYRYCFKIGGCGIPTLNGYKWLCYEHHEEIKLSKEEGVIE